MTEQIFATKHRPDSNSWFVDVNRGRGYRAKRLNLRDLGDPPDARAVGIGGGYRGLGLGGPAYGGQCVF